MELAGVLKWGQLPEVNKKSNPTKMLYFKSKSMMLFSRCAGKIY
jgi:hypothetical protein